MGAAKHIKLVMMDKEIKPAQLAEGLGITRQSLATKLSRDHMTFTDCEMIAGLLGCEVVLRDPKTGKFY